MAIKYGFIGSFGTPAQQLTLARACEEHGWDGFFTWDGLSLAAPGFDAQPTWDPFALLGAASAVTERITLGAMVFAFPRHRPWELAQRVLTVDHLSGGRLVLPVGVGVVDDRGFTSVPGQLTSLRERAELLDDVLEYLERSWSGEPFAFEGRHLSAGTFHFPAPPVNGRIPVWPVAVWDAARPPRRSLDRALRWDGIVPQVRGESPEDAEAGADDVTKLVSWIDQERGADAGPFEIVVQGRFDADPAVAAAQARAAADAGATWWIESWWDPATATPALLLENVRQGPPRP
ncbi:luciferase family protein [Beutenbergia cavernae DSM 12333]|uniref:Luciferase family protein n=1 Tax=Beutenbergia cavernae (strain ATCC BAA-8 / DSM 12333 / CCUG 43141 / JCM 11478 / NBRC 16432 / NCIMB 13614 / HKI 0122) TaxID=471853 RepID=C5C3E0_BEUC1|nr:LLM class flavin-dependent oxidoreductase [Beutenbergia cavernae]ACQ79839.1 luciferase family protein [Beutenbergia cavernae DSM 12333]